MPEMKPQPAPAFQPGANPVAHAAMVALRSSGAAGIHLDGRDRRARTRSAARDRAVADQD